MTYRDFYDKINRAVAEHGDDYMYMGIRFEDKDRQTGETCENSKHNPDRWDERDFPAYGTAEYDELPDLDGTSSWMVYNSASDWADEVDASKVYALKMPHYNTLDDKALFEGHHCYLIGGDRENTHNDADCGEIVIVDAKVVEIIY